MGPLPSALAAGAALLLAGCRETADSLSFDIQLEFDRQAYCISDDCHDYGMSCGAILETRLYDFDVGAVAHYACDPIAPSESLCDLANLDANIFGLAPHRMRFEVALWRPGALVGNLCPSSNQDIFNLAGQPRQDFMPQPAFGGAAYFDVGSGDDAVQIPLACTDAGQLAAEECSGGPTTRVTAEVDDMARGIGISEEQAGNLIVNAAEPRQVSGSTGYTVEAADIFRLEREGVASFGGTAQRALGSNVCALVRAGTALATEAAACAVFAEGTNRIDLRGVLVPQEQVDKIVAALGGMIPAEGLVLGRVVDDVGNPLDQVSLSPSPADAGTTVRYLDEDGTLLLPDGETSTSGYFISTDAPFNTIWHAQHIDGRRETGVPRAGLVEGKVTAVIVKMQEGKAPDGRRRPLSPSARPPRSHGLSTAVPATRSRLQR